LPAVSGIVPLNPPPPSISALPFQVAGKSSSKLIAGAVGSTGRMLPSTLQYSGNASDPEAMEAGIAVAEVTTAPRVGKPISEGEILAPDSRAQPTDAVAALRWSAQPPIALNARSATPVPRRKQLVKAAS
jgi:hypothetical protein